jgi:hypothetical protein
MAQATSHASTPQFKSLAYSGAFIFLLFGIILQNISQRASVCVLLQYREGISTVFSLSDCG